MAFKYERKIIRIKIEIRTRIRRRITNRVQIKSASFSRRTDFADAEGGMVGVPVGVAGESAVVCVERIGFRLREAAAMLTAGVGAAGSCGFGFDCELS
jgi:hypothetical protein